MEICIRENYVDTTALLRFAREELEQPPYNFTFAVIPDEITDCAYEDFDGTTGNYVFNRDRYNLRKERIEKLMQIPALQMRLVSLSQDIIQALAGEEVPGLQKRKEEFITLHNKLRELEGKAPREAKGGVL